MKLWAWIPARGGSQSIPRKNIQLFCNIPLLVHSIRYALSNTMIQRVIVTTDDSEIFTIASQAGAECILRPASISEHYTRDEEVLAHLCEYFKDSPPDWWIQLRPTYPIRPKHLLQTMIQTYCPNKLIHAVRTVVPAEHSPLKMYTIDESILVPLFTQWKQVNQPHDAPRQLLPSCYWHNGCIDMIRHTIFLQYKTCFPPNTTAHEMNMNEIHDIDTWDDFHNAEKNI